MNRLAAILIAASFVAGCANDPLRDVPRLSQADVSESDIQVAIRAETDADTPVADPNPAEAAPPRRGLLGRLFGGQARPEVSAEPETDPDMIAEAASASETAETPAEAVVVAETPAATTTASAVTPRRGLLGFLSRAAQSAQTPENADGTVITAALPQASTPAARRGGPKPGDPDFEIVPFGTALPFGTLARVCDVPNRRLGTRVERFPETRSKYGIYDSEPGNTAPHTFYVTGFDDGCVRQFTAAMALFGSPQTHEQLRYGLPSKVQPYSQTDAAYEKVKSRVCRVSRGKPCGSAMSRLARDTVFVSVYERFGSNPVWKTILLHDGKVVETDIRSN